MIHSFNKKIFRTSMSLRLRILELSQKVSALHVGGSFSSAEIITTIFKNLKKHDKFILSKGHVAILLYCILEKNGFIKKSDLNQYCQPNGSLGVHPERYLPGVEASTGSLGHGLGLASGMALSKKFKNIFVLMSDGELMEGSVWEAVLTISSLKLNNIILIIDNNDLQSATRATDTHPTLYPIDKKFRTFGWESMKCNGHNPFEINKMIKLKKKNKPLCIVSQTTKGYPISFMRDKPIWHYRSPNKKEYELSIKEIKKLMKKYEK
ncbi:transketolase, beta subunit [alpha proteobacterium HIMB114]|nr:transketolase, beta subunit [alpha proteobacterium HIMB114]